MTAVTFTRCIHCETTVMTHETPQNRLVHLEDGNHVWRPWSPAAEAPTPRPDHGRLSLWLDVKAALNHVHQVQFYLGYLPEKPQVMWDHEAIRMQLDDARAVLERLADGLWDQTSWPRGEAGS